MDIQASLNQQQHQHPSSGSLNPMPSQTSQILQSQHQFEGGDQIQIHQQLNSMVLYGPPQYLQRQQLINRNEYTQRYHRPVAPDLGSSEQSSFPQQQQHNPGSISPIQQFIIQDQRDVSNDASSHAHGGQRSFLQSSQFHGPGSDLAHGNSYSNYDGLLAQRQGDPVARQSFAQSQPQFAEQSRAPEYARGSFIEEEKEEARVGGAGLNAADLVLFPQNNQHRYLKQILNQGKQRSGNVGLGALRSSKRSRRDTGRVVLTERRRMPSPQNPLARQPPVPSFEQNAAADVQVGTRMIERREEAQNEREEVGQNFPEQEDQQSQSSSAASGHGPRLNEMTENAFSFQRGRSQQRDDENDSTQRRSSEGHHDLDRSDLYSQEEDEAESINN